MEDKVIVFQLAKEHYGVDLQQVRSIERMQAITPVPQTSAFIKGVMNLRGDITPIIDLKERLELGKTEYTEQTRVLIVQIETIQVGLIVDSATDVIDIDPSFIEPAPAMIGGVTKEYLKGVAKLEDRLLVLLGLEQVLNQEEKSEMKK
ncbi:chemotaxis protein CheW [Sutcliffiella cohnii]